MTLHLRRYSPVARAMLVFGVVASLVTGVTFAALNNQATLTNNTISSATAELQIKSSGQFAPQDAGFAFSDIIPGGPAVPEPGGAFQLRNTGGTDLDISVSIPALPVFSGGEVDPSKVDLIVGCSTTGGQNFSVTASFADLLAAHATGGVALGDGFLPKTTDNVANCTVQAQMDEDAIEDSVSSGFFNIVFHGGVHTNSD